MSIFTSYMLLGMEDIAARIEQPFEVLPLWCYVATSEESVHQVMQQGAPSEVVPLLGGPDGGDDADGNEK